MKFTGMSPIGKRPEIEIAYNGKVWDLHNAAVFVGHKYNENEKRLILMWDYGCDHEGIGEGRISIELTQITNLIITEKDISVPRTEDSCLSEMQLIEDDVIEFAFRGGQTFKVNCREVIFHSNETTGHQA